MTTQNTAQALAIALDARANCARLGNTEWCDRWDERLDQLIDSLPSGSGIDAGVELLNESEPSFITLDVPYHALNDVGYYVGWVNFRITVTPDLRFQTGFGLDVECLDDETPEDIGADGIADYLADVFWHALSQPAPAPAFAG